MKIIDLTQTIYSGMPMHHTQPAVRIEAWSHHDEKKQFPSAHRMTFSEHTGTHVDALSHMLPDSQLPAIDQMPLENFIGQGLCLDFSDFSFGQLIEIADLTDAVGQTGISLTHVQFVLLHTNHFNNVSKEEEWPLNPGLSADAALWLCKSGIRAFGIDALAPGVKGQTNKQVHKICGETGVTHYENLTHLDQLVGKGLFTFIGLPLKIKSGTGSPVRAVALLD